MFELTPFRRRRFFPSRRGDIFDNFLDSFFDYDLPAFRNTALNRQPFKVDVQEIDNSYIVKADMPGIKKEDINVTCDNNYLTISTKRHEVIEEKRSNFVRRERSFGEFTRSFYIDGVDVDKITASFEDGVLTINLPKNGNKSNKKIDIN